MKKVIGLAGILAMGALFMTGNALAARSNEIESRHIAEADGTSGQDTNSGKGVKTGHIQDGAVTDAKIADVSMAKVVGLQSVINNKADNAAVDALNAIMDTKASQADLDTTSSVLASKADISHGHFYGNMAIVATSGGEYTSPVDAMNDLANWCGTPSAANPCLVKIMPGVYDIGANIITMSSYTSLKGVDTISTIIKQSIPAAQVIDNSSRSNISISTLTIEGATGIKNYSSSSITVSDVKFNISNYSILGYWSNDVTVSNITATGINPIFQQGGSLSVQDAKLTATCNGSMCAGLRASDMASLKLNNLDIDVIQSGEFYSYGIFLHESYGAVSPVHELSNITINSTVENSWHTAYGISVSSGSIGAEINLSNIDIKASSPLNGLEYGLSLASYDVIKVRDISSSASTALLVSGLASNIKIENSILGGDNTSTAVKLYSDNNLSIANSKLVGVLDLPVGTSLNCFNNYDANYTAVSCP